MSFFSRGKADLALQRAGFDMTEELSLLIEWARHPDPKIAFRATKHLRHVVTQIARLNGDIGTVERSRTASDDDGREVRETARISTVMSRLQSSPEADGKDHLEHHPPRDRSRNHPQGDGPVAVDESDEPDEDGGGDTPVPGTS